MSKKILFISPQPFFQWRGSPIRVKFNLLALAKLGYKVDFLTLPFGEDVPIDNVRVFRVANPFGVDNIPIGPSKWKLFFDKLIFLKGLSLCLTNRYDVIHGIEEAGFIGAVLAKINNARTIFEKHSDPTSYSKGFFVNLFLQMYAAVERLTVRMSDAVICTGPGLVEQVNDMKTNTRAFNIFDIPSSLEEATSDAVEMARERLVQNPEEVVITYVGSFAVYQGVDLLFAAIPHVIKAAENARFVIIGGNTEEIDERRKWLEQQGAAAKVTFLGKIAPDLLPNYLEASDVLISPRGSGVNTPLKILDYMKAGRAIVATNHPSNRLLLDENSAVFSDPDPVSIANALVELMRDEQKRFSLGEACRTLYESTFTFDKHCLRLSQCYSTVLGEPDQQLPVG